MKNKNILSVYMLVTADKYEFPVCIADSMRKLAIMSGYKIMSLYGSCIRHVPLFGKYYVVKVNIEEPEDRFNFDDYKTFCKINHLSANNFKNLDKYYYACHSRGI